LDLEEDGAAALAAYIDDHLTDTLEELHLETNLIEDGGLQTLLLAPGPQSDGKRIGRGGIQGAGRDQDSKPAQADDEGDDDLASSLDIFIRASPTLY
jgi:hypothetical protein